MSYLAALALTLATEVPLVGAFYRGQRVRLMLACGVATTITHVVLHHVLPIWLSQRSCVIYGETLALLGEAAVYAAVARPRDLGKALLVSACVNGVSFGLGLLLFRA